MTRPRLVLGIALAILALLLFYLAFTILASRQPVEIAGTASLSAMRTPVSTSIQSPLPTLPYITQISPLATPTRVAASPAPLGPQIYLPDIGAGADVIAAAPSPAPTRIKPSPPPPTPLPAEVLAYTIPINTGGLHVEAVGDHTGYGDLLRACHDAGRPLGLVKVFGDAGSAMEAKTIDPRTVTIWRKPAKMGHGDDMDNPPGDWNWPAEQTADLARRWMQAMYPMWEKDRQYIDYYEIVNEPNMATLTQTQRAVDFMMAAMQDAESQDPPYHLAIWSFSSGTPEPWQAELIAPTLRYAAEHGHILSVHDGSVDDARPLFRQAYKDGTALRYRMFTQLLGDRMPRVAITEAYQPNGYWHPDWADWQWYLTELANDNVIGAAWFTLGSYTFGGSGNVNVVAQLPALAQVLGCR